MDRRTEENSGRVANSTARDAAELAGAFPRALIAEGRAERLATRWVERREAAVAASLPPIPRFALEPALAAGLFDARRARQLVRGLEGAEAALAKEAVGLSQAAATQAAPGQSRVSRLLVVSADGSARFYQQVERLRARFGERLEVVLIECDDEALGECVFGAGKRVRALMLERKEAVIRFLTALDELDESISGD